MKNKKILLALITIMLATPLMNSHAMMNNNINTTTNDIYNKMAEEAQKKIKKCMVSYYCDRLRNSPINFSKYYFENIDKLFSLYKDEPKPYYTTRLALNTYCEIIKSDFYFYNMDNYYLETIKRLIEQKTDKFKSESKQNPITEDCKNIMKEFNVNSETAYLIDILHMKSIAVYGILIYQYYYGKFKNHKYFKFLDKIDPAFFTVENLNNVKNMLTETPKITTDAFNNTETLQYKPIFDEIQNYIFQGVVTNTRNFIINTLKNPKKIFNNNYTNMNNRNIYTNNNNYVYNNMGGYYNNLNMNINRTNNGINSYPIYNQNTMNNRNYNNLNVNKINNVANTYLTRTQNNMNTYTNNNRLYNSYTVPNNYNNMSKSYNYINMNKPNNNVNYYPTYNQNSMSSGYTNTPYINRTTNNGTYSNTYNTYNMNSGYNYSNNNYSNTNKNYNNTNINKTTNTPNAYPNNYNINNPNNNMNYYPTYNQNNMNTFTNNNRLYNTYAMPNNYNNMNILKNNIMLNKNEKYYNQIMINNFEKDVMTIETAAYANYKNMKKTTTLKAERIGVYHDHTIQMLQELKEKNPAITEIYTKFKDGSTNPRYIYENIHNNNDIKIIWNRFISTMGEEKIKEELLNSTQFLYIIIYIIKYSYNSVVTNSLINSLKFSEWPHYLNMEDKCIEITKELIKNYCQNLNFKNHSDLISQLTNNISTMKFNITCNKNHVKK